jgi:hypothetical protein
MSATALEHLIAAAEGDLQAASNGAALCRITAKGAPGRSVKYFEGRWAALRALTKTGERDPDSTDLRTEAERLLIQWQADLERWSTHEGSSWIPYCEGGVAGLADYLREAGPHQ